MSEHHKDAEHHGLHHEAHEPERIEIIVNARRRHVHVHHLTYKEVVHLAFTDAVFADNVIYTVTYADPHGGPEGSLVEGQDVQVKKEMIINVSKTDKS